MPSKMDTKVEIRQIKTIFWISLSQFASISTFVSIGSVCIKIKRWSKLIQMFSNMDTKLEIEVQIDPNRSKNQIKSKRIRSKNYHVAYRVEQK